MTQQVRSVQLLSIVTKHNPKMFTEMQMLAFVHSMFLFHFFFSKQVAYKYDIINWTNTKPTASVLITLTFLSNKKCFLIF